MAGSPGTADETPGTGGTRGTGGTPGAGGSGGSGGSIEHNELCQEARGQLAACFTFDGHVKDGSPTMLEPRTSEPLFLDGIEGKALRVGPGRAVRVNSNRALDLNIFTIEVRLRLDRLPSPGGRMGLVDSDQRYGLLVLPGGAIACSTAGTVNSAPAVLQVGIWHHVACVRSSSTIVVLVDGREVATQVSAALPAMAVTKELVVGGNEPSGDEMDGLIDSVRIWRTAHSPAR